MTGKGATVMLPLHLQNEVIHPDGQISAGFGGPDEDRLAFVSAASAALRSAVEAGVQRIFVRMAFQPGGADLPDNCELYQSVKHNEVMREGSWGAEFFGALAPDAATDIIVSHNRVNAFFATDLERLLSDFDCDHVVLFGVATHSVVEHTARHAADLGLKVTLVEDACSAFPRDRHTASLSAIKNLVTVVPSRELALGRS